MLEGLLETQEAARLQRGREEVDGDEVGEPSVEELGVLEPDVLVSLGLADSLRQLPHHDLPHALEADRDHGEYHGGHVDEVVDVRAVRPAALPLQADHDGRRVVKRRDGEEDFGDEDDVAHEAGLGEELDGVDAEGRANAAPDKVGLYPDDGEVVDLRVVGVELDEDASGSVVYPVTLLEQLNLLGQVIDETGQSQDVSAATVHPDARVVW